MHLNKHFLFIIGAPALLVLLVVGGGLYRVSDVDEDRALPAQETMEHVVHEVGVSPGETERVVVLPHDDTMASPSHQTPATEDLGTHFSGTLEKVDTGCFSDGECYVVVDGKHITAVRGWSQQVVGTVQGVDGFGDLAKHIGERVDVYAYGAGDSSYTLYIRVASTSAQDGASRGASTVNLPPEGQ